MSLERFAAIITIVMLFSTLCKHFCPKIICALKHRIVSLILEIKEQVQKEERNRSAEAK